MREKKWNRIFAVRNFVYVVQRKCAISLDVDKDFELIEFGVDFFLSWG